MISIRSLASSSKGNCYIIDDGRTKLMIECGLSINRIRHERIKLTEISGCLITHEHRDHSLSWEDIINYTTIYCSRGTFNGLKRNPKKGLFTNMSRVKYLAPNKMTKINTFCIIPFETEHDSNEPLGFYIHSTHTDENLLFAIDTYYIRPKFSELNYIMIECNYSNDILDKRKDTLPQVAMARLLQSHFELSNVVNFLKANDLSKVKEIYLMHLSNGNSSEIEFKRVIEQATGIPTIVCKE